MVEYNSSVKTYLSESSLKVYSPEFQTIFQNKDLYGHNERLVMDVGDGCLDTSLDDIKLLNPLMMTVSQPRVALIRRGGRCRLWSEKIATIQTLSDTHRLQITAAVIYDDMAYSDTILIKQSVDNTTFPFWSSEIPASRNITTMIDENTLDLGSTFIAVYYLPYLYVESLNETYLNFRNTTSLPVLTQLVFVLSEREVQEDGIENDKPRVIIYSIVIVIAVLIVLALFRRCLMKKTKPKLVPFMDLHKKCPIMVYEKASVTNSSCAICLDDFGENSSVRLLPCRHGYCIACIDLWLTKKSSLCPICKWDCKSTEV